MRFSAATTADRILPERLAHRARPLMDRLDAALFTGDERGQAGRMSFIAFVIRIVSAVIAFVSQVLLARWMGGFEYGVFVLVWVTMVILGNISCLGFHTSVIRFIHEYREQGALDRLRGVLLASRLTALGAATLFAAIGIGLLWASPGAIENFYVVPFVLGFLCLPMIALSDVLQGIARAHSWPLSALGPIYITRPLLILAAMGGALLAGLPPTAEVAVAAAVVATYVTTLMQFVEVTQRTRGHAPPGPRATDFPLWLKVSFPIFLVESFFFLLTNADVLMVGLYMSPNDVAVYFATVKTLALVHFVYFAVKAGVAQRYAQYAQEEGRVRLAAFARETVGWTFWPSLAMGIVVLALGKPMLALFGPGFDEGYPLLFLLVAGVVLRASVGPAESLLTMSGHQKICALIYGLTLAVNVLLAVILLPMIGLWGAAVATAASIAFEAAALSFTVWRKLGIVMTVLPLPMPE